MNPGAIYSKSGKGVQEAAGKTSHLSRPDRAVLSAIDGRATLADVAQKVGKTFDPAFVKLVETLDKGGFIREVSPGTAVPAPASGKGAAAGAKPAAKPTAPMDAASDLDFTAAMSTPKAKAPSSPPPSAAEKAKAEKVAKEQQDAFAKAREDAEKKAQADRDRVKSEAEAKMRAETEARLRGEAEAKAKADAEKKVAAEAEAKIKAAREAAVKAAAEAKAKAEAEAEKAREEAERARKEAEEKARREQEELRRKLEEERKAREEAERKAKEEARRLEEERKKLEEERKRREDEKRREEEERAARKKREEEEEARERAEREARRKAKEQEEAEEEARARAEKEARRKAKEEQEEAKEEEIEKPKAKAKPKEPEPAKPAGSFSDSLLADLDSFTTRDEQESKEREEAERKAKEEAARRAREAEERRQKEEAERQEREEKERVKREAAERKAKDEAELREQAEKEKQRLKDEEEKRKKEADEREKKAKRDEVLAAKAERAPSSFEQDAALRSRRERELAARPRAGAAAREAREKTGWGKPIAIILFLALLVGVGVAHIMPIDVEPYQAAASDALRRPVTIRSANLSLITGLQVKLHDVTVGGAKVGEVRAYPELDALTGPRKSFSRIEIEGLKLEQDALGEALFARVKTDTFSVGRIVLRKLELTGPLALPKPLDAELVLDAEGALRAGEVRGPQALLVKLTGKGRAIEYELEASSFIVPFAPDVSLSGFKAKGSATQQAASVDEWDGEILGGRLSGNANVRWGDNWIVDGALTARNITAAVFAPALLSEGKGEGSGKFSMRGADPGKLGNAARLDGSFTVTRGVLGSIDLSRAIQTGGKQASGRTQFSEMNGQGTYDRGAVALRSITINAGQLNAGASADISQSGALSGRIVADVRIAQQQLRATLNLAGTLKEPQVKN